MGPETSLLFSLTNNHMTKLFSTPCLWKTCSQLIKEPDVYQVFYHPLFWWVPPGSHPGPWPGKVGLPLLM